MVKIRALLPTSFVIFLFVFSMQQAFILKAWGQGKEDTVKVAAEIDLYKTFENHPVQGTITITHDAKLPVEESSFKMKGASLNVELIKTVKVNEPIQLSLYRFVLPGQPQGLYVLPEISVVVGGKVYRSIETTYEVTGAEPGAVQNTTALRLDAGVEGATPLYPGQQARFWYRFYYTGNIELTEEDLPLLEAKGFQKIGDKQVKDFTEGGFSIQEISQEVQAITPGTFNFPSSFIEGYGYQDDILNKRNYQQPKLRAESPAIKVNVLGFPEEGKPATFSGAVGEYTIQTSLLTPPTVTVDDKMQLAIDILGDGAFSTISLPSLTALSNGLFRLGDLPPVGENQGNKERFVVDLYPLSPAITEIPSIIFSYYDPLIEKYGTIQSTPISIKVIPKAEKQSKGGEAQKETPGTESKAPSEGNQERSKQWQAALAQPAPIEIEANYDLGETDLHNLYLSTWHVWWLLLLGALLLVLQYFWQDYYIRRKSEVKPKSSEELFQEFLQAPPNSPQFYDRLNRAFLVRLVEKGYISSPDIAPEQLPANGPTGPIRTFLCDVEQKRFAGKEELTADQLMQQAKALF